MTPLKVNRTLPLCLRRSLLLRGLNRPAVSTLSSLTATRPPSPGSGGTEGPSFHQPRVEQTLQGLHSEQEGLPSGPSPGSAHTVRLGRASRPTCPRLVLWASWLRALCGAPRWSPEGQELRALLAVGRAAAWPPVQHAVVAPPASPPDPSSFPGWLREGPGVGTAAAVAEASTQSSASRLVKDLGRGGGGGLPWPCLM